MIKQLSGQNSGTILVTMPKFEERKDIQVVDNKMVGDTGFESVTSTVCKRHKKKGKRKL
jgi:hypothetical protein